MRPMLSRRGHLMARGWRLSRMGPCAVMNSDGSGGAKVASDGFSPVWSVDGRRIRYATARGSLTSTQIWEVSPDGSGAAQLAMWPLSFTMPSGLVLAPYGSGLQWSPDRSRAAFGWVRLKPDVDGDGEF